MEANLTNNNENFTLIREKHFSVWRLLLLF